MVTMNRSGGTAWEPSENELAWCRWMVRAIKDGGTWTHAEAGLTYQFDSTCKTLTLIRRADAKLFGITVEAQNEFHEHNKIAFEKIGYKMLVDLRS